MWALELCFLFFHHLFPQVSCAREPHLQHLVPFMDEYLDKVLVIGLAKTFSCSPDEFHDSGCKRLSQLSIDRGLGILAG